MAMTTCPDCGKEISTAAPTCPSCGRQMAAQVVAPPKQKTGCCAAGCLVMILFFVAVGLSSYCAGPAPVPTPAPPSTPKAPPRPTPNQTPKVSGCQPHIELHGAAHWARELGQMESYVLANHRINLWERNGANRGRKVGEMRVGSRAVILEESGDAYRVVSPLDGSVGWVSRAQVARTLRQDVASREACR